MRDVCTVIVDDLYDDLVRHLSCISDFCGILMLCLVSVHKPAHVVIGIIVLFAVVYPRLIKGDHMDRLGLDRQRTKGTRDLVVECHVSARCVTDDKIHDVGVYVCIRFLRP